MSKPRIYVDMDGVLCDYDEAKYRTLLRTPENFFPQASYGFFRDMRPITGAIEAYHWLHENFDTWILTRPSVLNPMCYTEKREWVEKHLGLEICEKLIMCTEKGLLKGDYLIDDMPWPSFEGQQITFGSKEYPNWKKVTDFFQMVKLKADWPGCEFVKFTTMEDIEFVTYVDILRDGKGVKRIKMDE